MRSAVDAGLLDATHYNGSICLYSVRLTDRGAERVRSATVAYGHEPAYLEELGWAVVAFVFGIVVGIIAVALLN